MVLTAFLVCMTLTSRFCDAASKFKHEMAASRHENDVAFLQRKEAQCDRNCVCQNRKVSARIPYSHTRVSFCMPLPRIFSHGTSQ